MGVQNGMSIQGHATVSATLKATKLDLSAVTGPSGLAEQGLRRAAGITRDRTKRNITTKGRVDTGRMRQSVDYKIKSWAPIVGGRAEVGIYTRYASWQELGTAGKGTGRIYPRHAKALKFKSGGHVVWAKSVRGVKPMNALRDAIKTLSPADFKIG